MVERAPAAAKRRVRDDEARPEQASSFGPHNTGRGAAPSDPRTATREQGPQGESGSMPAVVARARRDLAELLGQPVERVASVVRQGEGWRLTVDVVELARIPDSTSVLGSYDVVLDANGQLLEYQRTRRFYRNVADEEAW